MALMSLITLLLVVLFLLLIHNGVDGGRSVSTEEDLELEKQLKLLNSQPIRTVKTEVGHTYDCIDIQQQSALDHHLLKKHKVEMRPTSNLKRLVDEASLNKNSTVTYTRVDCPKHTVPIRRTGKEYLKRIKSFSESYAANVHPQIRNRQPGKMFAILKSHGVTNRYNGIGANINVQQPIVNENQSSTGQFWVETTVDNHFNSLQAGWIVSPQLYGDHRTHLFAYWRTTDADGTERSCFNTLCPGFVQTNSYVPVDVVINSISQYGGDQYDMNVLILQDNKTMNWWLVFQKQNIGYWPSSIVPQLSKDAAMYVAWGGLASGLPGGPSPPLGNGKQFNYWSLESKFQSYFWGLKIVDGSSYIINPSEKDLEVSVFTNFCYGLRYYGYSEKGEHVFSYGGQGGDCDLYL